jgi:LemA protein
MLARVPHAQTVGYMEIVTIIVITSILLAFFFVATYNKLVRLRNATQEGLSQIDVQLQRRNDLIPNLIETVKGYAAHEKDALEAVIAARAQSLTANTLGEKAVASDAVTGALKSLFALAEAYPDLKASENFLALQEELASTENRIGFARQRYNDQVRDLNTAVESIPTNIIAQIAKFSRAEYFDAEDGATIVPQVRF